MQSIFRYPGGKSKRDIRNWILAHKPHGVKEYREPFVGGGGIFFGLNASAVDARWINDKHDGLIAVYLALRDRAEEFIAACREIEPAKGSDRLTEPGPRGGKPTNARLKAEFDRLCLNPECDQALRYFFVNRTVHGSGRVNYDIPSRLYFSNPDGWNIVSGCQLELASEIIQGARITCGDYEDLFTADGEDVWIYADPPYVVNGNLTPSSQLYQHGFDNDAHRRFADVVARCKHKVCISYDDDGSGLVRSLFPADRFHIIEASWKYSGTTNATKEDGRELLILNYDPPTVGIVVPESTQIELPLTDEEREQLALAELELHRHFHSFVDAGKALLAIRDSGRPSQRLYRETHLTFEDYCESQWMMSKVHANRLIAGSQRYEELKTEPIGSVLPDRESHIRQLLRVESPADAAEVWQTVVQAVDGDASEITAKLIKQHVDEFLGVEPAESDPYERALKAVLKLADSDRERLIRELLSSKECAA